VFVCGLMCTLYYFKIQSNETSQQNRLSSYEIGHEDDTLTQNASQVSKGKV